MRPRPRTSCGWFLRLFPSVFPIDIAVWAVLRQAYARRAGSAGESGVSLAHLYANRALVHISLGDDASGLNDLDRAVAMDTRNIA